MSTKVHEVLGNPFLGPHVLSFLSIKDNRTCKKTNRVLFQIYTRSFPRLLQEKGRRLLQQAPDKTRQAFERHFGVENLSRAQVIYYPEISGLYEMYKFEKSGSFDTKSCCTKQHLQIGICRYEEEGFIGVMHCCTAPCALFLNGTPSPDVSYHHLNAPLPDERALMHMSVVLETHARQHIEKSTRRSVCDVVRSFFGLLSYEVGELDLNINKKQKYR